MTINTSVGIKNDFVGVEEYGNDIPEVLPPIPLIESSIFDFEALALLNPKNQLINDEESGLNMESEGFLVQPSNETVIYPNYDVIVI